MSAPTERELLELQETLYNSKNPTRRWLHQTRRDWIVDQIARTDPCETALEVGPGSGIYLPHLCQVASLATATDIEEAYLNRARELTHEHANLSCQVDDITRSKLPADHFDLILCTEVIEHVPDPQAALHGLFRVLRPGGKLILSTPQKYSPLELSAKIAFLPGFLQLTRLIYREAIQPTGHISLLTDGELQAGIAKAGFIQRETHKSGFYLPLVAEGLGQLGLRLEQWCERSFLSTPLSFLLWTQYSILTKDGVSVNGVS